MYSLMGSLFSDASYKFHVGCSREGQCLFYIAVAQGGGDADALSEVFTASLRRFRLLHCHNSFHLLAALKVGSHFHSRGIYTLRL